MNKQLISVVVSSDASLRFLNFWPIVVKSWNLHFSLNPTLVLVAKGSEFYKYRDELSKYGEIFFVKQLKNISIENQSKMARWYYACTLGEKIASIEDIDTIFLGSDYLNEKWSYFNPHLLLGIGSDIKSYSQDAYEISKFPASNLTGTGNLFAKLFNYEIGMSFEEFLENFRGLNICDSFEDPFNPPQKFSDESLIRALRIKNNFSEIVLLPRDVDIRREWLDRSWWPKSNNIELQDFICVNFPRPLFENRKKCATILNQYFPHGYPWILQKRVSLMDKFLWLFAHYKNSKYYWQFRKILNFILKN
jgi:hypothetical protein